MTDSRDSSFSGSSASGDRHGRYGEGRRALNEPVLSSVEEELNVDTSAHDTGTSYTGPEDSTVNYTSASSKPAWWTRMEDQMGRYVSEQPAKAALMALGAGALVALLVGQTMRGRRRRD